VRPEEARQALETALAIEDAAAPFHDRMRPDGLALSA
jgi:hypothetical protein